MKNLLLIPLCFTILLGIEAAPAQDVTPAPGRDKIVIDFFSRARVVPAPYAGIVRQQVLAGFVDRGRQTIIDAEASRPLCADVPGSGMVSSPQSAATELQEFLEYRLQRMADMDARYVVTGAVTDYKFEHVQLPADGKKPPVQGFQATFQVVLSAYDLKFRRPVPDEIYTLKGRAPVAEDADKQALLSIRKQIEFYIDKNFKFETLILELCPPDRKGRIRELYIHSGTDMGVREGDLFLVYEDVPIGGVMTRQKVGRLRVNNVQNPDVARCKITKGEEEIVRAFRSGRGLVCVSDGKALFY